MPATTRRPRSTETVTVLESFPPPRATSVNPFTLQLAESLRDAGVDVRYFRWRDALFGRYDVFHVHWPENLAAGRTPVRALVRQALTALLIGRLVLSRRPLVRTVHNLDRPEGLGRGERALLDAIDRVTALRIVLNDHTPLPPAAASATIVHPHFREWFADFARQEPIHGRLGFVGRIRRYKGVEALVAAVSATPGVTARIGGYPSTPELAAEVERLAAPSGRIVLDFGFISDALLVDIVTSSELVVLPYRVMHNSAAALTALSLDRPVLVPSNAVTEALRDEVGSDWVHTFRGDLAPADIERALAAVRSAPRGARPRLVGRTWELSASGHVAAFTRALSRDRGAA